MDWLGIVPFGIVLYLSVSGFRWAKRRSKGRERDRPNHEDYGLGMIFGVFLGLAIAFSGIL